MLQVQSHDALHVLKEDHSEVTRQLRDAQEVLSLRSRENNELPRLLFKFDQFSDVLMLEGRPCEVQPDEHVPQLRSTWWSVPSGLRRRLAPTLQHSAKL